MANERYYDELMRGYYRALVNAWDKRSKEALRMGIQMLSDMPRDAKASERLVRSVEESIRQTLTTELGYDIAEATRKVTERVYAIGLTDTDRRNAGSGMLDAALSQPGAANLRIGLGGLDKRYTQVLSNQNMFWIQNHYVDGVGSSIMDLTKNALEKGMTAGELAVQLKATFQYQVKKDAHYYQKLAEHSMLKVREIGAITGYEKAGATAYEIVAVMDDRTSDICIALNGQVFPMAQAVAVRDAMLDVDLSAGPEAARDYLKRVSPWVSDKQVVYRDSEPVGIQGEHTPFPPFHWGCRTTTRMIYDN